MTLPGWPPPEKYYDAQGNVVSWDRFCELRSSGMGTLDGYKRVSRDLLPNGRWISTVWIGHDHNFSDDGPPLIFESRVWTKEVDGEELDAEYYATLTEAAIGHSRLVRKWTEEDPE